MVCSSSIFKCFKYTYIFFFLIHSALTSESKHQTLQENIVKKNIKVVYKTLFILQTLWSCICEGF